MVPRSLRWIRFIPLKLHLVLPWLLGGIALMLSGGNGICACVGLLVRLCIGAPLQVLKHRANESAKMQRTHDAKASQRCQDQCPEEHAGA